MTEQPQEAHPFNGLSYEDASQVFEDIARYQLRPQPFSGLDLLNQEFYKRYGKRPNARVVFDFLNFKAE